jgi:membrane-associated phospholipid phosphatase
VKSLPGFKRLRRASTAAALVLVLGAATAAPADTISKIGDIGAIALPASGLVAALAHKDKKGALQLAEAFGTTMAIVYILKPTVNRQRPDGGSQSFPSGHSASAFAGAAFLQRRYGWSYGVPAYAVATFVAYSRVEAKRHYTSDVIVGGAIGLASNFVFTHRKPGFTLQPLVVPRGAGLTLEIRW